MTSLFTRYGKSLRLLFCFPLVALFVSTCSTAQAQTAQTVDEAAIAASGFFASVSARDAARLNTYLQPEGFTEFMPESGKLLKLDAQAFTNLFASPLLIDLRLADVQVQHVGDAAVVTGTRLGYISKPGVTPQDGRLAVSMIWSRQSGGWKLHHIHLSVPGPQ